MKNRIKYATIFGVLMLAGCGSKSDANEENFGVAISQYLDKKGGLCLHLNRWPVDVTEMDLRLQKSMPNGMAGKMKALEAVGLVSGVEAEVDQIGMFDNKPTGHKFKVTRYVLTVSGKRFYNEKEVNQITFSGVKKIMRGDICYGKKILDQIVKWEGPTKFGDYQEAKVIYLYKIDALAEWTKKPEIRAAFPYVAQIIDAAREQEQQGAVKLTSLGWEPKGLD